jgi:hypothetical protein
VDFKPQLRASPLSQQIISSILNKLPSTSNIRHAQESRVVHRAFLIIALSSEKEEDQYPLVATIVAVQLDLTRSEN